MFFISSSNGVFIVDDTVSLVDAKETNRETSSSGSSRSGSRRGSSSTTTVTTVAPSCYVGRWRRYHYHYY